VSASARRAARGPPGARPGRRRRPGARRGLREAVAGLGLGLGAPSR
jgi:hypothetical protein